MVGMLRPQSHARSIVEPQPSARPLPLRNLQPRSLPTYQPSRFSSAVIRRFTHALFLSMTYCTARRSGLRSLPRRCPSTPASPGSARSPAVQLRVLLLQFLQPPRLIYLQATKLLAPSVVSLLGDSTFPARNRGRLAVRHRNFDLPQQIHNLLRRVDHKSFDLCN